MKYVFIDPTYEALIHRPNQISFRNMEQIAQKKDIEDTNARIFFLERDIEYTTIFVYIEFYE